jgi:two-component system chemotaxis response regulator CheB
VVTLDIQMPRMDGLTALKHIMIRSPKPVVILSAFTKKTSQTTYEAFKYGAVDVLAKPSGFGGNGFEKDAGEIRNRVAEASGVRIEAVQRVRRNRMPEESTAIGDPILAAAEPGSGMPVVVVCCGAGGFSSLLCFLASWSSFKELPAMIACVDMPRKAVEIFAPSMAKDFGIPIEAVHSQPLSPGDCFLCSVEDPYRFVPTANGIGFLMPREAESPSGAFDQLLLSAAECFSQRAAAFLISGTGEDGITGMRRIQEAGGQTFALSPEACTKPELSREILNRGLAREVPSAAACARFLATWRLE